MCPEELWSSIARRLPTAPRELDALLRATGRHYGAAVHCGKTVSVQGLADTAPVLTIHRGRVVRHDPHRMRNRPDNVAYSFFSEAVNTALHVHMDLVAETWFAFVRSPSRELLAGLRERFRAYAPFKNGSADEIVWSTDAGAEKEVAAIAGVVHSFCVCACDCMSVC